MKGSSTPLMQGMCCCAVVASPVRRARARNASAGHEGAVLLGVLLEFWLSDGDQSMPPGPSQDAAAHGSRQSSVDSWGLGSGASSYGWVLVCLVSFVSCLIGRSFHGACGLFMLRTALHTCTEASSNSASITVLLRMQMCLTYE